MTISVKLDPDLERRLRARLAEGITLSDYVRKALVETLERDEDMPTPYDLWQKHFDGDNGTPDGSERIGSIVKERLRAKHRAR